MPICEFIRGLSGVRCELYHMGEERGLEALTPEFKQRVCHSDLKPQLPYKRFGPESSAEEPETCPRYESLITCVIKRIRG